MDDIIISTWGIGPSYRDRVKKSIIEAMESGYEKTLDYVILTDYPKDFLKIAEETGKIKAIIDIHEERKGYDWSYDVEAIPDAIRPKKYGEIYTENLRTGRWFSYGLHRFSLPTISRLGYKKIVFMDSDVKLEYDLINNGVTEEEFWNEFNSPVNSMKGCIAEDVKLTQVPHEFFGHLQMAAAMGAHASRGALQLGSAVLLDLYKKYKIDKTPILMNMPITEGPFRYYHFDSSDKVLEYFNIWNEIMQTIHTNKHLQHYQMCGGYNTCDYIPVAITNIYHDIKVLDFPNTIYKRRIFYEDRYFLPPMATGLSKYFTPGESVKDFFRKNKKLVKKINDLGAWPHKEDR